MRGKLIVYGATWCSDCWRSIAFLDSHRIEYEYINIDNDKEAANKVEKINNGLRSIPTILLPDKKILVEPTDRELSEALHI